jgi:2-phospho-L-lactate guanylyltransferase
MAWRIMRVEFEYLHELDFGRPGFLFEHVKISQRDMRTRIVRGELNRVLIVAFCVCEARSLHRLITLLQVTVYRFVRASRGEHQDRDRGDDLSRERECLRASVQIFLHNPARLSEEHAECGLGYQGFEADESLSPGVPCLAAAIESVKYDCRKLCSGAFRIEVGGPGQVRYKTAVRFVLIAAKELAFAKTRLASALPSVGERSALAAAMFRDVLSAALAAKSPDRVAVITSEPSLLELSREAGAIAIDEQFPRGLNVAVKLATDQLMRSGVTTVCTMLSDTPGVTGEDVDTAFAAMPAGEGGVVLVPSRDFSGTNMIVRNPPEVIATQFGRFSLVRHLEDCREKNIACEVLRLQRPALDLDLPADLFEFARLPGATHTQCHLARLGLVHG